MITTITSVHNARVKQWSELLIKRGRDRQNRFLLEGIHLVEEALRWKAPVETLIYSLDKGMPAELQPLIPSDVEIIGVSEAVLSKCSETVTPQGVLAVSAKFPPSADQLLDFDSSLVIAIDGIQDPGNLGTIIRTADAAGAHGVVIGKGSVDLYNPKTVRSTMGSLFHLPVVQADLTELLAEAGSRGIQVLGTGMSEERTCYDTDCTRSTWFVVGNEGSGVSEEVSAAVSSYISIPMPGHAESLNVAMAAGILMFEAVRQRRGGSGA